MARRLQLFRAGGGGAYRYVAVQLAGVGGDYSAAEGPGKLYGERGLAGRGRPGNDHECLFLFRVQAGRGYLSPTMRAIWTITSRAFSIDCTGTNS